MNSDPKQCLESKLGQVHSVYTPMAQAAHTLCTGPAVSWHTRRHVVAHQAPCRGLPSSYRSLCPAVSWPCRRRVAAHMRALVRRVVALCRDTRPCRRPLPVTIQNLYHDPSPCLTRTTRRVARAAARVAAPSAVSWCIATLYRSPGALYCYPKLPPSAMIQFFLYRDLRAA